MAIVGRLDIAIDNKQPSPAPYRGAVNDFVPLALECGTS
jgi:hypothetical protein